MSKPVATSLHSLHRRQRDSLANDLPSLRKVIRMLRPHSSAGQHYPIRAARFSREERVEAVGGSGSPPPDWPHRNAAPRLRSSPGERLDIFPPGVPQWFVTGSILREMHSTPDPAIHPDDEEASAF